MAPDDALVDRFRTDLDPLIPSGERFGIAVSGGPDSLALLLLAAATRPGEIEAATVDHGLRAGSCAEAETVADICEYLAIPHSTLRIEWDTLPPSAIQEKARSVRYDALGAWLRERRLNVLLTAHHLDDQAETLVMRLNRGSGVRGLAGMRRKSTVPGALDLTLLRPLLGWRRTDLERVCSDAGVAPVADPSNFDERFERVRIRRALAAAEWLQSAGLARSAENLARSNDALEWTADQVWSSAVEVSIDRVIYREPGAPSEIARRILSRIIARLGAEGDAETLRGSELDRLLVELEAGRTKTLRGVRCSGGAQWTFTRAAPRSR